MIFGKELWTRLFSAAGSFASLLGVLLTLKPNWEDWSFWPIFLAVVSFLFFVALVISELRSLTGRRVYRLADKAGIRDYMYDWISNGGQVAIWTRDLSWVNDDAMRELLSQKAKANELIICLPTATNLTTQLQDHGAKICAYAGSQINPGSRFTIVHLGKDGARVAVGRTEGTRHVIEEFAAGEHPAFYMAEDLVDLARRKCSV